MSVYVYNDISVKAASSANKCNELSHQWNSSGVEDNKTLDNCSKEIVLHTCFVMYCIHYYIVLYCIALHCRVSEYMIWFVYACVCAFFCVRLFEWVPDLVRLCMCVCVCVCVRGRERASGRGKEGANGCISAYLSFSSSAQFRGNGYKYLWQIAYKQVSVSDSHQTQTTWVLTG